MKYCLDELKIYGVKNPNLIISGWVMNNNYKINIYSNGKIINEIKGSIPRDDVYRFYNEKVKKNKFGFNKSIRISNSDKIIKVEVETNDGKKIIATTYNLLLKRIYYKIIAELTSINLKIKHIIKSTAKFIYTFIKYPNFFSNMEFKKFLKKSYQYDMNLKMMDIDDTEIYNRWLKENDLPTPVKKLNYNPLISIIMPVYNPPQKFLEECIDSILKQTYQNFEICIADDASPKPYVKEILEKYKSKDPRVKVIYREKNGNISAATNSALTIATGEYIALVDNDDLLTPNALYENVYVLNKNKNIDLLYSDEDKLDLNGKRCLPHFKADWSPDTLLSINYITHFTVIRRSIVNEIGGFRTKCDGAQDYDIVLRATEKIKPENIYHIPKILYIWRMSETSTALDIESKSYAFEAGRLALEDALKRRNIKGKAEIVIHTAYKINYEIDKLTDKVSIIIPIKDQVDLLIKCLSSIKKYTDKDLYEIIIINNNSSKNETISYLNQISKDKNITIINNNEPFNYSKLNNIGIKIAKNKFILFLNNDVEVTTKNWLEIMLGFAKQQHIGAVGPELFYKDHTIQHAGVVLGLGKYEVASHPFIKIDGNYEGPNERIRVPYNYSAVTGACMLVEKRKIEEVGGFDEKLAVNYNDVDLCIKLLKKGYYNVFIPQVKLIHYESKTRGYDDTYEKIYRTYCEVMYIKNKWGNILLNDRFYNPNLSLHYPFKLNEKKKRVKK
jgi:O-antigen biosynthesis protein